MIERKKFSALVLNALVLGMGLVGVGVVMKSEFLGSLGVFPLLSVIILLPHALVEWEAARGGGVGNAPVDKAAHLGKVGR